MIYNYKYLDSKIQLFHEHLMYFFVQLFKVNPSVYDEDILLKAEFIPIVNTSQDRLLTPLKKIVELYNGLPFGAKQDLEAAFSINTCIEYICTHLDACPVKYVDLNEEIADFLKHFFESLWQNFKINKLAIAEFGTVQEHFDEFTNESHQNALICPFCGLLALRPSGGKKRNQYDHFIPQATYPFVSINFKNLFPSCSDCNIDEKSDIDTPYNNGIRRPLIYPFDEGYDYRGLKITINPTQRYNPSNLRSFLKDINWSYDITLNSLSDDRLNAWDEIFNIRRRYKECLVQFEKTWFDIAKNRFKFCMKQNVSFDDFKSNFFEEIEAEVYISQFGMLRLGYYEYLFSLPNFEDRIYEMVSKELVVN